MKIGYLLLSGDPIHIGHISMASKCINDGIVDEVRITVCVQNPWKGAPIASFEQRCEMISNICKFRTEKNYKLENTINYIPLL